MALSPGDIRYRNHCDKCGVKVGDATMEWSLNKYGASLCWNCQPKTIEEVTKKWEGKQSNDTKN